MGSTTHINLLISLGENVVSFLRHSIKDTPHSFCLACQFALFKQKQCTPMNHYASHI